MSYPCLQKITHERRNTLFIENSLINTSSKSILNDDTARGSLDDIFGGAPMDGNLKRNSSYMKKLRLLNAENFPSLVKDFPSLSLQKFLTESIDALLSVRLKNHLDIAAIVELSSLFHQKYKLPFTSLLFENLQTLMSSILKESIDPSIPILFTPLNPPLTPTPTPITLTPKPEENKNILLIARRKMIFKLFLEFRFCGLFSFLPEIDLSIINMFNIFLDIPSTTSKTSSLPFLHLSLINNVLKFYSPILIGAEDGVNAESDAKGVKADLKGKVFTQGKQLSLLLNDYYRSLLRLFVSRHSRCMMLCKSNRNAYERGVDMDKNDRGFSLLEDISSVDYLNKEMLIFSQFLTNIDSSLLKSLPLFEGLDSFAPTLSKDDDGSCGIVFLSKINSNDFSFLDGTSAYEDEDERRFYEDLIILQDIIPKVLLSSLNSIENDGDGDFNNNDNTNTNTITNTNNDEEPDLNNFPLIDPGCLGEDEENEGGNFIFRGKSNTNANSNSVEEFYLSLQGLSSQAQVDKASIIFCHLNKGMSWRKGFVENLFTIIKRRTDLLPFIARFIATISSLFRDVGEEVRKSILGQWLFLAHKPLVRVLGTRNRIARFSGELCKFSILPQAYAFSMMKLIANNDMKNENDYNSLLSPSNVEMLSTLLDCCGRFLTRQGESLARMKWLDSILRKKIRTGILGSTDHGIIIMLENALLSSMPPTQEEIDRRRNGGGWRERKVSSPKEQFVFHLLGSPNINVQNSILLLRKFDLSSSGSGSGSDLPMLIDLLSKASKFRTGNLKMICQVLVGLRDWHPLMVERIIDRTIEEGFISPLSFEHSFLMKKRSLEIKSSFSFISEMFFSNLIGSSTIHLLLEEILRKWSESVSYISIIKDRIDSFSLFHSFFFLDLFLLPISSVLNLELIKDLLYRFNRIFIEKLSLSLVNGGGGGGGALSKIISLMEEEEILQQQNDVSPLLLSAKMKDTLENMIPKEHLHKLEEVLRKFDLLNHIPYRAFEIRREIVLCIRSIRDGSYFGNGSIVGDDLEHEDDNVSKSKDDFEDAFLSFLKDNQKQNILVERRHVNSRLFEARVPDNFNNSTANGAGDIGIENGDKMEKKKIRLLIKKNQVPLLRDLHSLPGDYQQFVIGENARKAREKEIEDRCKIKASVLRDLARTG